MLFAKAAGIDVQLVPFKGSAEISQAVLARTVDFALDSTATSLPLIQAGRYRALSGTSMWRSVASGFAPLRSLNNATKKVLVERTETLRFSAWKAEAPWDDASLLLIGQ